MLRSKTDRQRNLGTTARRTPRAARITLATLGTVQPMTLEVLWAVDPSISLSIYDIVCYFHVKIMINTQMREKHKYKFDFVLIYYGLYCELLNNPVSHWKYSTRSIFQMSWKEHYAINYVSFCGLIFILTVNTTWLAEHFKYFSPCFILKL